MNYQSNIWKYFIIQFTNRRNFIPILSVYYLSLPDSHPSDIGIYMGLGYVAALVMQLPSGYIADHFGQKNALIISKFLILLSTILLLLANNFLLFSLGAIFMAVGLNAFSTGTTASFLKGTLEKLGRGQEYRHIASEISGNVSLLSIGLIVALPFLTEIDIRMPLLVSLILDLVGLIMAFILYPVHTHIEKEDKKSIKILMKELRGTGFFPYALFIAIISGFLIADNAFRSPYLISLGYPLAYIGLVMAGSRFVWWGVGRIVRKIEKYLTFNQLIITEICLFPLYYITTGFLTNPWIVGCLFSIIVGWFWGRSEIYTDHLLERIEDTRYRATALSIKSQIQNFVEVTISFGIAGVMGISYALGFQVLGITMFILLISVYYFGIRKTSL